jgi:hypothetical protein
MGGGASPTEVFSPCGTTFNLLPTFTPSMFTAERSATAAAAHSPAADAQHWPQPLGAVRACHQAAALPARTQRRGRR